MGVLALGREKSWSGISDSEKLLVLFNACPNFLTDPTRSESLPNVETTRIDGVAQLVSLGLCPFRSRDLSELRAFLIELSTKESGYPAFLKQALSSSSLTLRRS